MSQRTWTLRRHDDSVGCVLAVTSIASELDALADALANTGTFAFAAIGSGVASLCSIAAFDLIAVLASVDLVSRATLRSIQPHERLLELGSDDIAELCARVGERLAKPRAAR